MGVIREALKIVDQNRNACLAINAFYYGQIAAGAIYAISNPVLRQSLNQEVVNCIVLK
jgi:hypothetical protein